MDKNNTHKTINVANLGQFENSPLFYYKLNNYRAEWPIKICSHSYSEDLRNSYKLINVTILEDGTSLLSFYKQLDSLKCCFATQKRVIITLISSMLSQTD